MNTISLLNALSNSKISPSSIPNTIGDGLVLYWSFENNSYNETITGAAPLSVAGTPSISTSIYKVGSSSLSIPNGNSYLNFYNANGVLPATTTGYSFSIWFNLNTTPAGQTTLFQFTEEGDGYNGIMVYFNGSSLLLSLYKGGGSFTYNLSSGGDFTISSVTTGVWYHLVVTIPSGSGTTVFPRIYLNSVIIPCPLYIANEISLTNSRVKCCIGSVYNNNTVVCNGYIDEFRVYNRILNTTEISILYLGNFFTSSSYLSSSLSLSIQKSFSYGLYDYYVFSTGTSFTCSSSGTVNYIMIGGGGAGGGNHAGGGGGGGVAYGSAILLSGTNYTATVGAGGTGGGGDYTSNVYTAGVNNGGNSSIIGGLVNIIAYGGGYGGGGNNGYAYNNGTTGNTGFTTLGSGGGGMAYNLPINTATIDIRGGLGGLGSSEVNNILYGYTGTNGGAGYYTVSAGNGGGGGGAGEVGGNASSTLGGNGGNGIASTATFLDWLPTLNSFGYMNSLSSTWATDTLGGKYIAAGGGGGSWIQNGWQPGTGGLGGGGAGGANGTGTGLPGSNGAKYTGSGGGGGSGTGNVGGNGGNGLVAIRSLSPNYTSFDLTNQYVLNGYTFGTIEYATRAYYTATVGLPGNYTFSVSSAYNTVNSYFMNMFTNANISGTYTAGNKGWIPKTEPSNAYTINTGIYKGRTSTTYDVTSSVLGEWIQIKLPLQIIIQQYSISGITDTINAISSPTLWILLGSNDGTTWSAVDNNLSTEYNYPSLVRINQTKVSVNVNEAYLYYRFVINKTGGRAYPYISNFNLIGVYNNTFTVLNSISTFPYNYVNDPTFSLWIDANNKSSINYNSSTNVISNITNLSYNTGSMTIGGNANKTIYLPSNSFTTTPVIRVGDYSEYSSINTNINNINYQTELTFFWVVAVDSTFPTTTGQYLPQLYGPDHFSNYANSANISNLSTTLNNIQISFGEMGATNNNNASNFSIFRTDFIPNSFQLISFQSSIISGIQRIGFNGDYETIGTPFPGGGDTAYCVISSSFSNTPSQNAPLYYKEIICFTRALSNYEFQTFEGYLAWKWGINSKLPASHPYVNNISSIISVLASSRIVPTNQNSITWNSVSNSITNYTAMVEDKNYTFFSGLYTIYASSAFTNQGVNYAFNASSSSENAWLVSSESSYSSGSSPYYTNNTYTTIVNGNTVYGEWIEIDLPVSDIMYSYSFKSYSIAQYPTSWIIAGANSNDGPWTSIANNINNTTKYNANNVYTVPSSLINTNLLTDLTTIPGLKLWLDANEANTFSTSSGILTWIDKSGTNHNAVSNSTTTTIVRNTSGAFPYVYFNAGDIQNASLTISNLVLNTFPFTFFCVFNSISGSTDLNFLIQSIYTYVSNYNRGIGSVQISLNPSSGSTTTISINAGGGAGLSIITNAFTTNAFHILTVQITSSSPNYTVNIDGTSSLNIANPTFPASGSVADSNAQGIQSRGGTMYIAETILYQSQLTQSQYQQVEGYLARKWGLNAVLPYSHPYYSSNIINTIPVNTTTDYSRYRLIFTSAYSNSIRLGINNFYMKMLAYGSEISNFSPVQISGLNNWYDASDPNGNGSIPTNGTNVTTWYDKTDNANHMIAQSEGTYASNSLNGLGTITFNNSWYRTASANAPYPFDAYVVVKLNNTTTVVDVLGIGSKTSDDFNSLTFSEYTVGYWHNGSSNFSRTPNAVSASNETSTSYLLMSWSFENNKLYIYRNGVQIVYTNSYTWSIGSDNEFRIGQRMYTGINHNMQGSIAEVLFYNMQLSTINRQKIEGYLAWKWGLQTNLSNTHPYYTSSPNSSTFAGTKKIIDTLSTDGYNALVYQGTTLQAGAFGVKLLLYNARNSPVIQIKAGTGGIPTNFYASIDENANLTTGINGTGTEIIAFLNGAIGYVTKWYDQTGNGHHAFAQGSPLPFYDTINNVVDFGSSGYFTLDDGSFPSDNLPYTYFFKQGRINNNSTVWSGGWGTFGNMGILLQTPHYNDTWYAYDFEGMIAVENSFVAATYGGGGNNTGVNGKKFYVNNILQSPTAIDTRTDQNGLRTQTTDNCYLGASHPNARSNYETYKSTTPYFYWMPYQLGISDISILRNT